MPFNHLILCHPLLFLPLIFPNIRIFSNVLHISWPKYWSFSFSISTSSEYSGLISFRIDCLDLLAAKGTLKRILQHHSSEVSNLQRSTFFTVQLSHSYMTTGKSIALTRWTFVGKVMSLLFNMLSRLVITFLPRSNCLLISWLQLSSVAILEPPQSKVCHYVRCFPIYLLWSDGTRCHDLSFLNVDFQANIFTFTFIKRLFSSSSLSAIRVVSSVYLRLLIFLLETLIPACASSSPAFLMMCSAYKLNKQDYNIQLWCTPFLILNQSLIPCLVLTVAFDLHTDFSGGR